MLEFLPTFSLLYPRLLAVVAFIALCLQSSAKANSCSDEVAVGSLVDTTSTWGGVRSMSVRPFVTSQRDHFRVPSNCFAKRCLLKLHMGLFGF